jgi:uncharacterized damage-inducible protein DinB
MILILFLLQLRAVPGAIQNKKLQSHMTSYPKNFRDQFILEIKKRLFEENVPRLKKCLAQLTETEIWYRPNAHSNSIGNLVLHLCGNVRQWVLSGLGEQADTRKRQQEFDEKGPVPTEKLVQMVDELMHEVERVLDNLSPEMLLEKRDVQVYRETGLSILVHVVEHFSYHVGQMTYFVKWRKDMDIGYYSDTDLENPNVKDFQNLSHLSS